MPRTATGIQRVSWALSLLLHLGAWVFLLRVSHHWTALSIEVERGRSSIQLISVTPARVEEESEPAEIEFAETLPPTPRTPPHIGPTTMTVSRGDPAAIRSERRSAALPDVLGERLATATPVRRVESLESPTLVKDPPPRQERRSSDPQPKLEVVATVEVEPTLESANEVQSPARLEIARGDPTAVRGQQGTANDETEGAPPENNARVVETPITPRPRPAESQPQAVEPPRPLARSAAKSEVRIDATVAVNSSRSTGALGESPPQSLSTNRAPAYPAAAIASRREGEVVLLVRIRADGAVGAIAVSSSSGSSELDRAAVDAVRLWMFRAARRGDQAVETEVLVPIVFRLR